MTTWVTCTTHAATFPAGWEDEHKRGPLGEQNAAGECHFETDEAE